MTRKKFIQDHGATCANWFWSWSFVNQRDQFVIFGSWQDTASTKLSLILHVDWEYLGPRRQPGYKQAIEHIRLVEKEEYGLYTFPITGRPRDPSKGDLSPSKITKLERKLAEGRLVTLPESWYVAPAAYECETIAEVVAFEEGAVSSVLVNAYERNPHARKVCIDHFGARCQACGTDFGLLYGPLGEGYIHVHHIKPIHLCGGEYRVDPIRDLIPVCANCHAMIHRRSDPLTVDELRKILKIQSERHSNVVSASSPN